MLSSIRKKLIIGMIFLMILFGIFFVGALSALNREIAFLNTGFPMVAENYVVIILSIIGIIMAFSEIIKADRLKPKNI